MKVVFLQIKASLAIALRTGGKIIQIFFPAIIACPACCFSASQTRHTDTARCRHSENSGSSRSIDLSTASANRADLFDPAACTAAYGACNCYASGSFAFSACDFFCIQKRDAACHEGGEEGECEKLFHFFPFVFLVLEKSYRLTEFTFMIFPEN